jgi:hypothetical protein
LNANILKTTITLPILLDEKLSDDDLAEIGKEILEGERLLDKSSNRAAKKPAESSKAEPKPRKKKAFQKNPKRRSKGARTKVVE